MFIACGIWCLADVSSVSPSSEQTAEICLFGPLIASNRTIIPEICCCDVFWCEEQCVLCLVFVIV